MENKWRSSRDSCFSLAIDVPGGGRGQRGGVTGLGTDLRNGVFPGSEEEKQRRNTGM